MDEGMPVFRDQPGRSAMGRIQSYLFAVVLCAVLLSGCSNFTTISSLQPQDGQLSYVECKVTILNTILVGLYAWTEDCQPKTLKLK
jgi:hypothetical protein